MAIFNLLDESVIGQDPSGILSPEFSMRLHRVENAIPTPVENEMVTMMDPKLLAVTLPRFKHLDLNEQLSNKLYVIGVTARQRRRFDIFDCHRIVEFNSSRLDWKAVLDSFHAQLRRESASRHIDRARRMITRAVRDSNTVRRIESGTFEPLDFGNAAKVVSELYSKLS